MRSWLGATVLLLALTACRSQPEQQHPTPVPVPPTVHVGVTSGAAVLLRVDPVLPELAKRAKVYGPVILEVRVDETGKVEEVMRVMRGDPLLDQLARDAARQWRFEPVTFHGALIPVVRTVVVSFKDR